MSSPWRRWLQARAREARADDRAGRTLTAGPTLRIATFDRRTAAEVAQHAPGLARLATRAVARRYAEVVEQAVAVDVPVARALARSLPAALAAVPDTGRPVLLEAIADALAIAPGAALAVARLGAGLVDEVPLDRLRAFAAVGAHAWAEQPAAGEAFLRREVVGAAAATGASVAADAQGRLARYAATHGADLEIDAGRGEGARLDGDRLTLPRSPADPADARALDRVVVARAAAHHRAGPPPAAVPPSLNTLLETRRIDAALRRRLPGLGRDLDRVAGLPGPRRRAASRLDVDEAVVRFLEAWALGRRPPAAAPSMARIRWARLRDRLAPLDHPEATPVTSAHLARTVLEVVPRWPQRSPLPGEVERPHGQEAVSRPSGEASDEGPPTGAAGDGGAADPPGTEGSASGDTPRDANPGLADAPDCDEAPSIVAPSASEAETEAVATPTPTATQAGQAVGASPKATDAPLPGADGAPRTVRIDDWDATVGARRPGWSTVREREATDVDAGFVARVLTERAADIRRIRRTFEALRLEGLRAARRQPEGPEIDLDAAVEARVERRAGRLPDGGLHLQPRRHGRDVACLVLVDLSSSTREVLPSGGRIIDVEKEAVLCLGEALDGAGDALAVLGFSGHGRDDVRILCAKDFDAPWDARARARIGGLRPLLENRDGAAIRHATERLATVEARTRLLLLLSDGRPLDCGDPVYHGEHARADTAAALREARAAGLHTLCLTVAPGDDAELASLYGPGGYVVVHDPAALPSRLVRAYTAWAG